MKFLHVGLLSLVLLLQACASKQPKPPKTQELFKTLIKRDGTKQFNYALVMEMPESNRSGGGNPGRGGHGGGGPGGGGPGGGGPGGGGPGGHGGDRPDGPPDGGHVKGDRRRGSGDKRDGDDERLNFLFNEGLTAKLGDTAFCRQGFSELDKQNRFGAIQISGECNDKATDEDRAKFPNPPPKKVKEETIE